MLADESNFIKFCEAQNTTFEVRGAVLLHVTKQHLNTSDNFNVSALTFHNVKDGEIQLGEVIDKQSLIDMLRDDDEKVTNSFISSTTLIDSAEQLVWYTPTMRRPMRLMRNKRAFQFNVAKFPATLFACNKKSKSLKLFALDSDSRPTPETQLYQLPVGNISSNGHLCLGSGNSFMPENIEQAYCEQIEKCFFDALSTHTSCDYLFKRDMKKRVKTPYANIVKYWLTLAENGSRAKVKAQYIPIGNISKLLLGEDHG